MCLRKSEACDVTAAITAPQDGGASARPLFALAFAYVAACILTPQIPKQRGRLGATLQCCLTAAQTHTFSSRGLVLVGVRESVSVCV